MSATDPPIWQRLARRVAHGLAVIGVVVLLLQAASIVLDAGARWLLDTPIRGL